MKLVEGIVRIGDDDDIDDGGGDGERFEDVGSFLDSLEGIGETHDVTVQAFDARYVVSRRHLERALELADRERERGEGIVRDRGVEMALYAAGRRQIDRAFEIGVSAGETRAIVAVDGSGDERAATEAIRELLVPEDTLGEYDRARVRSFYDIGATELDATDAGLEALVLERVALLVVER